MALYLLRIRGSMCQKVGWLGARRALPASAPQPNHRSFFNANLVVTRHLKERANFRLLQGAIEGLSSHLKSPFLPLCSLGVVVFVQLLSTKNFN